MIQHFRSSQQILIHEPGVPSFPKVLPFITACLWIAAILFRSFSLTTLGLLAVIYWIRRHRQLRREREEDEIRTLQDNYPCSKCGILLRGRRYAVNECPINGDFSTAKHVDCYGYYCYACEEFDNWPVELALKEVEARRYANGLKWGTRACSEPPSTEAPDDH